MKQVISLVFIFFFSLKVFAQGTKFVTTPPTVDLTSSLKHLNKKKLHDGLNLVKIHKGDSVYLVIEKGKDSHLLFKGKKGMVKAIVARHWKTWCYDDICLEEKFIPGSDCKNGIRFKFPCDLPK